jgi:phenylacetate-coenzyme A ligase PaaK-like adenylate-forming protein
MVSTLEELRARHISDALAQAPGWIERLAWDADTLAAHRDEKLRSLMKVAVERSPWHRDRLAGVCTDAFTADRIDELPVMTKHDVMANFDEIVTDRRLRLVDVEVQLANAAEGGYLLERYSAAATGGSTGARSVTVYDWDGWIGYWLSAFRGLLRARVMDPALMDRQITVCWVTASHPSHISAAMARTFNDPGLRNVSLPVTLPMEKIVAGLNETQPDVLVGYSTVLLALTREAMAGRLRIAPLRLTNAGEPLLPEIRAALARTWPVQPANWWGSTEVGCLILPCDLGHSHLAEDVGIVEPVDAQGRPVPPGERAAKVYVTNLFNHALPLIRYEITDEITVLPGRCECGSVTPRVADVQGRLDDWFVYPTGTVHPHLFRSILGRRPGIAEYQVRQTEPGADIVMCCTGHVDVAELHAELVADLSVAGLTQPRITITVTERLERLAHTGKLKRFVPLPLADGHTG